MSSLRQVTIHTDGSCIGNPGPGGYAAILEYQGRERELSGGFRRTTNNRMEMLAVIVGLEALKGQRCKVTVYSDSRYVVDAIEKGWARKWKANGWMRNKRERAVNSDLWGRLLNALQEHDVDLKWVRGHSGNIGNIRADKLAVAAAKGPNLPPDEGFENPKKGLL